MNVQIPVKWLQELLALCGPEDHELRERVMVSITAMDEQAARAVARPEPDEPTPGIASELADMLERSITGLGHYRDSENWSEADEEHIAECNALLDRFNCADDDERALLATATGLPAHVCKDSTPQLHVGDSSFEGWYAGYVKEGTVSLKQNCRDAYAAGMGDPLVVAAPQAQADARDAGQEKPTAGCYVLAWMEGKEIPIRAMWVPKSWLVAGDECPEGWAEYDEDKDEYFCPEGWYEANEHEETHWHVGKPIIAWAELPRYAAIAAAKGE